MEDALSRPTEVSVGSAVIAAPVCAGLLQLVANAAGIGNLDEQPPMTVVLLLGLWLGTHLYIVQQARLGRNWARILAAVLAGLSLLTLPTQATVIATLGAHPLVLLSAAATAVSPIGLILLFRPTANQWFRAVGAQRAPHNTYQVPGCQ